MPALYAVALTAARDPDEPVLSLLLPVAADADAEVRRAFVIGST